MSPTLEAKQVWKVYDTGAIRVEALRGINVSIGRGERVAVVGPSGCGKTTLLNCISGLEDLSAGEIFIEGQSIFERNDHARTKLRSENIGFIFQNFNLIPVLSAVENVELPLLLQGVRSQDARSQSLSALELVGLRDWSDHKPMELSGGQQQRVSIARAFVHHPSAILGDEPTGNLDTTTSEEVIDLLFSINRQNNTTLLIVTHDTDVAAKFDRILHIQDGMIIKDERQQTESPDSSEPQPTNEEE